MRSSKIPCLVKKKVILNPRYRLRVSLMPNNSFRAINNLCLTLKKISKCKRNSLNLTITLLTILRVIRKVKIYRKIMLKRVQFQIPKEQPISNFRRNFKILDNKLHLRLEIKKKGVIILKKSLDLKQGFISIQEKMSLHQLR